jgi:hypothetical protein
MEQLASSVLRRRDNQTIREETGQGEHAKEEADESRQP